MKWGLYKKPRIIHVEGEMKHGMGWTFLFFFLGFIFCFVSFRVEVVVVREISEGCCTSN